MKNRDDKTANGKSDPVEDLFAHATPRRMPPAAGVQNAREALHREWRELNAQRRKRQVRTVFALAASTVLAIAVVLQFEGTPTVPTPAVAAAVVATVAKQSGSRISVQDIGTARTALGTAGATLHGNQVLRTGADARVALEWAAGGSLRLGRNTAVRLVSANRVDVLSGRVYFDSQPFGRSAVAAPGTLSMHTPAGVVAHLGTQFLTEVRTNDVRISVREGSVRLSGEATDSITHAGQAVVANRARVLSRESVPGTDERWHWTQDVSPDFNLDGHTVAQFLSWFERETGSQVRYQSPEAAAAANATVLHGTITMAPAKALATWLLTTDLQYLVVGDEVLVSLDR